MRDSVRDHLEDYWTRRDFCSDWWLQRISAIDKEIEGAVPEDFLNLKSVRDCGIVTNNSDSARSETYELEAHGWSPPTFVFHPETDISHMYYLYRLGINQADTARSTIVEWGGGFGNLARIARQDLAIAPTHIIMDIPVMSALQNVFLETYSIGTQVYVPGASLEEGSIVLHPSGADLNITPDHFLGMWSVGECTKSAHDYLIDEVDWFGAANVLLTIEPDKNLFPDGSTLYSRLLELGFREGPCYEAESVCMKLRR